MDIKGSDGQTYTLPDGTAPKDVAIFFKSKGVSPVASPLPQRPPLLPGRETPETRQKAQAFAESQAQQQIGQRKAETSPRAQMLDLGRGALDVGSMMILPEARAAGAIPRILETGAKMGMVGMATQGAEESLRSVMGVPPASDPVKNILRAGATQAALGGVAQAIPEAGAGAMALGRRYLGPAKGAEESLGLAERYGIPAFKTADVMNRKAYRLVEKVGEYTTFGASSTKRNFLEQIADARNRLVQKYGGAATQEIGGKALQDAFQETHATVDKIVGNAYDDIDKMAQNVKVDVGPRGIAAIKELNKKVVEIEKAGAGEGLLIGGKRKAIEKQYLGPSEQEMREKLGIPPDLKISGSQIKSMYEDSVGPTNVQPMSFAAAHKLRSDYLKALRDKGLTDRDIKPLMAKLQGAVHDAMEDAAKEAGPQVYKLWKETDEMYRDWIGPWVKGTVRDIVEAKPEAVAGTIKLEDVSKMGKVKDALLDTRFGGDPAINKARWDAFRRVWIQEQIKGEEQAFAQGVQSGTLNEGEKIGKSIMALDAKLQGTGSEMRKQFFGDGDAKELVDGVHDLATLMQRKLDKGEVQAVWHSWFMLRAALGAAVGGHMSGGAFTGMAEGAALAVAVPAGMTALMQSRKATKFLLDAFEDASLKTRGIPIISPKVVYSIQRAVQTAFEEMDRRNESYSRGMGAPPSPTPLPPPQ